MLNFEALAAALDRRGFARDEVQKVIRFTRNDLLVAVKRAGRESLVVMPDAWTGLIAAPEGVIRRPNWYHDDDLRGFPKRLRKGKNEVHCGVAVNVADEAILDLLLTALAAAPRSPNALDELSAAQLELVELPQTERNEIRAARIGQGRFRDDLIEFWDKACAVTGLNILPLLRASHIKPWKDSNNAERLSHNNGLLLSATLDAAFDARFISFDERGKILFSERLGANPHEIFGIAPDACLRKLPTPAQLGCLTHHSSNFLALA